MTLEQQIKAKQLEIRRLSAKRRAERDVRQFAFEAPRQRLSAVIFQFPLCGARKPA